MIALAQFLPRWGKVEYPQNCHSPKILVLPSNASSTLNSPLNSKPPYLYPSWSKAILNITLVMIYRRAHLARFRLDPLAVPRRYSGPWAVSCPRTGAGEAETANESAPRRGVLGPLLPNPSYHLLRAPNVQAFTINTKAVLPSVFFSFLFLFFFQGNQRLGLYKSTQDS